jgi:pimeloyl-ACP methyl ester carboxylesterase
MMLTPDTRAAGLAAPSEREPITPGVLQQRSLHGDPAQGYFVYLPRQHWRHGSAFVTVHGISRNAREHAETFASYAERYGVVLIAPIFTRARFPRYQRLSADSGGVRPDRQVQHIIREVDELTGKATRRLYLFGYSGGGQFVHRFLLTHPRDVARVVVGAAGWYTLPDAALDYPLGLRGAHLALDMPIEPERFLGIPTFVLVGERDNRPDKALRKSRKVSDLQGMTRQQRGSVWIDAMRTAASHRGLATEYGYHVLPRCRHSFRQCVLRGDLARVTFALLFDHAN